MLADIDAQALALTLDRLSKQYGSDVVRALEMDVSDEMSVEAAFSRAVVEFGGVDILVSNAGIASSAPVRRDFARAVE